MVIIAESDPFIFRLLQRFSEESGYQVVFARLGKDVLELAREMKPTFIILEAELPGNMRGWDVIRSLKENPLTRAIPVITCSWSKGNDVAVRAGEVQGNLQKPDLHYEDFVAVLKRGNIPFGDNLGEEPWR
jgi:CheY-like chemotaxis protein